MVSPAGALRLRRRCRVGKEVMIMATKKIGRSAESGRFIPVRVAQQQKNTSVVETIKVKKGK